MSDVLYRPRSASEVVDAGFQLLRGHYRSFVTITAVTYAPVLVALLVLQRALGVTPAEPNIAYLLATAVLTLTWYSLSTGALILAADDAYAGRAVHPASALRRAAGRMGATFVALLTMYASIALVAGLVAGVGSGVALAMRGAPIAAALSGLVAVLVAIAGALYLLTRWFAVPTAHMLEGIGPFAGMGRSWRLSDEQKWRLLGTLVLLWVIYFVLTIGLGIAGAVMQNPAVAQVLNALAAVLVYPLLPVTLTVLYYDARIRREGYDLELLERELGAADARPASPEQPAY